MNRYYWILGAFAGACRPARRRAQSEPARRALPPWSANRPRLHPRQLAEPDKTLSPKDMQRQGLALQRMGIMVVFPAARTPGSGRILEKVDIPLIGLSDYKEVRGDGGFDFMSKMPADEERKLAWQRANSWLAQRSNHTLTRDGPRWSRRHRLRCLSVPETYVIDKAGVIRMKHTGPVTPEILAKKINAAAGGAGNK